MTPQERLYAEELPTGTFGHARPPRRHTARTGPTWTPEEQAHHLAELARGIDGWLWDDDHRDEERRHLRLITDQNDTTAA